MAQVIIKAGEGKAVTFTVTNSSGGTVDVSDGGGCTLTFAIKARAGDSVALITKSNSDFDKTNAATGVVLVTLTETDTGTTLGAGTFIGELKCDFGSNNIDKSDDIEIQIDPAVTT